MRISRKAVAIALVLVSMFLLTACDAEKITYPHIEYRNSSYNFDIANRIILCESGYELSDNNPYDIVETADGYDLVLHFVAENE